MARLTLSRLASDDEEHVSYNSKEKVTSTVTPGIEKENERHLMKVDFEQFDSTSCHLGMLNVDRRQTTTTELTSSLPAQAPPNSVTSSVLPSPNSPHLSGQATQLDQRDLSMLDLGPAAAGDHAPTESTLEDGRAQMHDSDIKGPSDAGAQGNVNDGHSTEVSHCLSTQADLLADGRVPLSKAKAPANKFRMLVLLSAMSLLGAFIAVRALHNICGKGWIQALIAVVIAYKVMKALQVKHSM